MVSCENVRSMHALKFGEGRGERSRGAHADDKIMYCVRLARGKVTGQRLAILGLEQTTRTDL